MRYTKPSRALAWPVELAAVDQIAESEGLSLIAYKCPAGIWTIGRGHTDGVKENDSLKDVEEADLLFCDDLVIFTSKVEALLKAPATPNQLAAMVSFAFNVGIEGFKKSSVLKNHNAGDFIAASKSFGLWNKIKGKESAGLTARRAKEAALYLTPSYPALMPQSVDKEKPLSASTITHGGVAAAASGVATLLGTVSGQIKTITDNTGVNPLWVIGVVSIAAGAWVVYNRVKQRRQGLA